MRGVRGGKSVSQLVLGGLWWRHSAKDQPKLLSKQFKLSAGRNNERSDNWDRWWINLSSLLLGCDPYGTNQRPKYRTFIKLSSLNSDSARVFATAKRKRKYLNMARKLVKTQTRLDVAKRTQNLEEINFTPSTTLPPISQLPRLRPPPTSISQQNLWSLMENLFPFINLFFPSSRLPWLRIRQIRH